MSTGQNAPLFTKLELRDQERCPESNDGARAQVPNAAQDVEPAQQPGEYYSVETKSSHHKAATEIDMDLSNGFVICVPISLKNFNLFRKTY